MSSAAATPKRVTCRECGALVDPHDAITIFELSVCGKCKPLKLNVVAKDGHRLSLVQSFTRTLGELVSVHVFGAGYLVALFIQNGEALHDFMARSRVVTL